MSPGGLDLHAFEESSGVVPMLRDDDVHNTGILDEVCGWPFVDHIGAYEITEGHAKVRAEDRDSGRSSDAGARLFVQIGLAGFRDHSAISVESHVCVIEQETVVWTVW